MNYIPSRRMSGCILAAVGVLTLGFGGPANYVASTRSAGVVDTPGATVGGGATQAMNTGACCLPDGSCRVLKAAQCSRQGGTYQGNGTNCVSNPCAPPTGACCLYDAELNPTCIQTTGDNCVLFDGWYRGDNTNCLSPGCPIVAVLGACCLTNASGNAYCVETSESTCQSDGGTYVGDGTLCVSGSCIDPNDPTGACCIGFLNPTCVDASEGECNLYGGFYQGNGTSCATWYCGFDF